MLDYNILKTQILNEAPRFGFLRAKITSITISEENKQQFQAFIQQKLQAEMSYLARNINLRFNPNLLFPNTSCIIQVSLPYLNKTPLTHLNRLNSNNPYISCYALGRDYHKILKAQLNQYASWINEVLLTKYNLSHHYRAFTDSAPIMEVALGSQHGLGWRGKNSLLINKNHGSFYFLGEIFTNLPLVPDNEVSAHCGSCSRCLDICPTKAFIKPYLLDAGRCISYLTIENPGPIPIEFRKAIGNRIYGCDDCQLICPWNKFAKLSLNPDFKPRNYVNFSLLELLYLTELKFKQIFAGSAIYRIGYFSFMRNVIIATGNSPSHPNLIKALKTKLLEFKDQPLLIEQIFWALNAQCCPI